MTTLGNRIQQLRKEKGMTQTVLAKHIKISLPQLVRYETKEVQPTAETLKHLSNALGVSIDFLVNGNLDEKAASTLSNSKLLQHFKAVEKMNNEDKSVVLKLIDAFITKKQIQQLAS
jgi:transcriptional regulator with XRE-family HTH domain